MKKSIIFISILLSIFLMIGCVSAGFFDFLEGFDALNDNPDDTFVVGFNSQFPPFGYVDADGEYTGFDLELAQEVAKRNNWTFKAQPIIDWNTKKFELDSREIDCIWSEFTINGREDDYTWTEPYFNNTKLVIVRGDSGIESIDDLNGSTLEVQQGSSILKTIAENETLNKTFGSINEVDGYDTAFMDLESGVCDVIIIDSGLGRYMVNEKFTDAKVLDQPLSNEVYGVAFAKGDEGLKNQVQDTLNEMYEDGTVKRIAQKYEKYGIPDGVIYPN